MSVKDREALAALFNRPAQPEQSVAQQRAGFEALATAFPITESYEAAPGSVGGVTGEWVRGKRVTRSDAAILYLHGGGYVIGSPKSHRHMLGPYSIDSGLPIFAADYRLAPENPFPAAVDDAVAAYKGLLDSGLAPSSIAISGDSAGGGLTIATLVAARDKGLPMPACAVAISPWVDLSQGGESFRARAKRDPIVKKDGVDILAQHYLGKTDPRTPLASPAYADLKGLPPLLIQVGTEEALHSDALTLAKRAEDAGVEVSLESWGGMVHVWHIFHPILGEGRDAIARAAAFIKRRIP
ncbi:MAG: alpha/beta hydrolase [Alphaproteobacteria bacterium]|nr:alpha/beta hydrolase [Alphaproteobacteria bacterium]